MHQALILLRMHPYFVKERRVPDIACLGEISVCFMLELHLRDRTTDRKTDEVKIYKTD